MTNTYASRYKLKVGDIRFVQGKYKARVTAVKCGGDLVCVHLLEGNAFGSESQNFTFHKDMLTHKSKYGQSGKINQR